MDVPLLSSSTSWGEPSRDLAWMLITPSICDIIAFSIIVLGLLEWE
jgi:hypothetical protein